MTGAGRPLDAELRSLLRELDVPDEDLATGLRLRADLALDSTDTTQLELELDGRFGVRVDLWDSHDYTLGELSERIEAARRSRT
jgi:2,3-dihydroxybenzoate-AMP ligase